MTSLNNIKNWFKTGLKPTQAQFWAAFDSFWHKEEQIPLDKIADIQNVFDDKVDKLQGKELSSNDFTDTLKEKLEKITIGNNIGIATNITIPTAHNDYLYLVKDDATITVNENLNSSFRASIKTVGGIATIAAGANCTIVPSSAVLQDGKTCTIDREEGTNIFYITGQID